MINPCETKDMNARRTENTCVYALTNIHPMENHPFKVKDDEDMAALVESIRQYGVLNPIIVRKRPTGGGYEIVSGHRRYEACKRLNKFDIPVIVRDLTDEEAILTMVDANLQRERILPSEKAFAYKMKMDVLRHQGSSCQDGTKRSDEALAESTDDSARQIQRYIRLTELIQPILEITRSAWKPRTKPDGMKSLLFSISGKVNGMFPKRILFRKRSLNRSLNVQNSAFFISRVFRWTEMTIS